MPLYEFSNYKREASYYEVAGQDGNNYNVAYWTHFHSQTSSDALSPAGEADTTNAAEADANTAETVLFIHGFPSASWDWHSQWQALKNEAICPLNLVAIDMLGFGLSDKPSPYKYSLIEQADIIETIITALNIKHCHVLAHDYGDSVAQTLLSRHESEMLNFSLRSICYLNGGLFAESHRPLLTQKLLKSPLGPLITAFMSKKTLASSFKKIFAPQTQPTEHDIDVLWNLLEEKNGTDALHYLLRYIDERHEHRDKWVHSMRHTDLPQLFINGLHDPISGKHMLEKFEELIPNARAVGIDAGHYPQIEASETINQLYIGFLNKHCS